ncbi:hypothetical protein RRG08_064021 [Elysia crispata]|uniref:Uncharacterized protein n=1 Tax=Elysia crispata TaxID=231223 RepID=A0AAE0YEM7_9GAST|nr:hypothetical protein RRG08_064021 [Elysia crispata]
MTPSAAVITLPTARHKSGVTQHGMGLKMEKLARLADHAMIVKEKKKTLLSPDLASPLAPPVMPAISRAQCSASIQRKPVLLFLSILEGHRESPGQRLTKPRVEPLQLRTIAARKKKPEFCSCTSAHLATSCGSGNGNQANQSKS